MLSPQTSQPSASPAWLASLSDPAFRRRLEADPVGVLAEQGIEISASDLPSEIRLPNADELEEFFAAGPDTPGSNGDKGNGGDPSADITGLPVFGLFLG